MLDRGWRRTSYSDITAASHENWVGSEPEDPLIDDEPEPSDGDVAPDAGPPARRGRPPAGDQAGAAPSPLAAMPAGAEVGTFVHRVLEATDFAAADLESELTARVAQERGRRGVEIGDAAAVVAGLRAAIEAPLGPVLGGRRLADIARGDRLDELGFELPLVGGDTPTGTTGPTRIAAVLRAHLAPEDPMAAYADRLGDAGLRDAVRGYLTGSLDLVVRVRDAGGGPERFAVLDYKTNRLGDFDQPLTLADYRPALIAAEMHRRHYSLQALLYLVALYRFLRWRVPGFDPDSQLAGAVYLFVRGCDGAQTPFAAELPYGVFGWRPPAGLVAAVSDALDGGDR